MSDVTLEAPELREYLLALADDDHLMGQQHTEWIGVAPFLEEDMALASIGQDERSGAPPTGTVRATSWSTTPPAGTRR